MKTIMLWRNSGVYAIILVMLSTVNSGEIPQPEISQIDKVFHFLLYMIFTFIIVYDFKKSGFTETVKVILFFSAAASSVFGGCMEILQLIPELHRSADIADFYANTAGSAAAVILFPPVNGIVVKVIKIKGDLSE